MPVNSVAIIGKQQKGQRLDAALFACFEFLQQGPHAIPNPDY